jgi:hypothetical protein
MALSIEQRMLYRIRAKGRGWVFSARHFLDFGSRKAIDLAFHRLAKRSTIRRLTRGVYDYPKTSPILGMLSPSIDAVANEIAGKNNSNLKITGSQAANALGLTTQVPAKIVFLTDGPSRQVKIGSQTIQLKHASPRAMATANQGSGLVIEALKYLGKENLDQSVIERIGRSLSDFDKKELRKNSHVAPDWMRAAIEEIAK